MLYNVLNHAKMQAIAYDTCKMTEEKTVPTAYEGNKPYIFVSYSHKDKQDVMRYIDALEQQGFLVWFDGGIEAGSEWPEYIANRLASSACVLAFISDHYVDSKNCRRELALAQDLEKEQLNVYIRSVDLPLGMRMQLGLNQAMWRDNFKTESAFIQELCKAKLILNCQSVPEQPKAEPKKPVAPQAPIQEEAVPAPVQEPIAPEVEAPQPEEKTLAQKCKRLGWIGSILELAYIPISIQTMMILSWLKVGGFWMFLLMIAPHTVIALINRRNFSRMLKANNSSEEVKSNLYNASLSILICCLLATLVSIIGGAINLSVDVNFFVRLLIALGLNIVPSITAGIITLFLTEKP